MGRVGLALLLGLAACTGSGPSARPGQALLEQCTAASGFSARAAAARAAGVEGKVIATPEELSAINACAGSPAHAPAATAAAVAVPPGHAGVARRVPRQCSLQMVGGSGYRCSSANQRY